MTARFIDRAQLDVSTSSVRLTGALTDVPISSGGGSCPETIRSLTFAWSKPIAGLSPEEQSAVADAVAFLQGHLDADESCDILRDPVYWELRVSTADGSVTGVRAYVLVPTLDGPTRAMWSRPAWSRSQLSPDERVDLDAIVAVLVALLEIEEPL